MDVFGGGFLRLIFLFFIFISCAQEEVPSSLVEDAPYEPTSAVIYTGDINLNHYQSGQVEQIEGKNLFSQDVSSGYVFMLSNKPSGMSINASTGVISITTASLSSGLYENIEIKAIGSSTYTKTFSVAINSDPLFKYAWHLENTAQTTFAMFSVDSGEDLNLVDLHASGITGSGVKIAISDVGVEINHDDLVENGIDGEHRNYSLKSPYIGDPTPTSAHGTAVTGIVSAVGWNNMGSRGVAPGSKFAGFQFLNSLQSTTILVHQSSGGFDIFNFSYGDAIYEDTISDADYIDHLKDQVLNNKKIFVKAAGNEFLSSVGSVCAPHNANFPYENESPYLIVVGALAGASTDNSNPPAIKATYSNAGSNIWVSAPGGEYGYYDPAIITTDLPTCFKGYSKAVSGLYNDFEYGHDLNSDCHYSSTMNGTSSAAPMVSGVIALMLQANSSLTQREIKDILAKTATKVNPNHDDNIFETSHPSNKVSDCTSLNLAGHDYELGWVQNGANYWFNNFYGFGMVDAAAAVAMAKTYSSGSMGILIERNSDFNISRFSKSVGLSIPDASDTGRSDVLSVALGDNLVIESVQVRVNVTHPKSGQIGVELTSPAGTKSILMNINNSFLLYDSNSDGTADGDQNLDIVLTSHAFYGEEATGAWSIKVLDGKSGSTGQFNSWKINLIGH